jgi:diguanylate cyclase (GGDEF)-like protein
MAKSFSNRDKTNSRSSDGDIANVLLVGNASDAFDDSAKLSKLGYKHCESLLDAITLASRESFEKIYIVMSNFPGQLESTLTPLRRANLEAKIILLAQMHEEPKAIEMTSLKGSMQSPANDYFICPADKDIFDGNGELGTKKRPPIQQRGVSTVHLEKRIEELEKLATEDDLTGLKNRRYVREFFRQIIQQAKHSDMQATLFVFDIDNFKHYNDTYGHPVGDMVLKQAAIMMQRCCREHDIIGRIGGDEFAVIFWDCPVKRSDGDVSQQSESERRLAAAEHPHEAFFMSERFRKQISSTELTFLGTGGKGELTISGGLASFPRDGLNTEELFVQADKAMLEAKRSGKNSIYLIGSET